ncbi:MAG: pyrroline-5-carboxylate reductase [Planctomycetes bacterium]|nr:pyrroline-5-carboxylate reductase [Planctomycetota bacterium]
MQKYSLGFIGFGNMGSAIAYGILESPALADIFSVTAYDIADSSRGKLESAGGGWSSDPVTLAASADFILLAVKPDQIRSVIAAILPVLAPGKTVISIAAGQPLSALRKAIGGKCSVVQAMPNTPAMIGDGVFGLCLDDPGLSEEHKEAVLTLFRELGTVFVLKEEKINALMAVTGAGPAYVFDMMDAVMEAAVTLGLTRKDATDMVVALFRGSARMVEKTGLHPAILHSQVTSPNGTTIAGTNHLARTGVRGHIIDAVLAAAARGKAMEME